MSPRRTAPKPPRPWQRQAAGTTTSSDGRFTIDGESSGHWYVRDAAEPDELGLPRTTGPFATLAAAKAAAERQRDAPAVPSPLAEQLRAAAARTSSSESADVAPNAIARRERGHPAAGTRSRSGPAAGRAAPTGGESGTPRHPAPPPAPMTWLEDLESRDREAARLARSRIRDLEVVGSPGAEALVRRDLESNQPLVAGRLLAEAIRRAVASRLDAGGLSTAARDARVVVPDGGAAFGTLVVARTLEVVLGVVVGEDRLAGAPSTLPGWEVVERGGARRRIRISAEDLLGDGPEREAGAR